MSPDHPSSRSARRRVLVVATNFPPDAAVGTMRVLRLVRQLAHEGWDVDMVTMAPERYRAGTVVDPALLDKVPSSVSVLRPLAWRPFERAVGALRRARPAAPPGDAAGGAVSSATRTPSAPARKSGVIAAVRACAALPDREVSWTIPAVRAAWRRTRRHRPDVIFSSGPPYSAHLVASAVARLTARPWVAEFRDPWARAPWRDDRFAFEKRVWSVLEKRVVSQAAAIVFVTETNRREFAEHYGAPFAGAFHTVPNGCELSDFEGLTPRPAVGGRFVLLHAGSLYGARNPEPLFRAVARALSRGALNRDHFRLRFIGRVGVPGLATTIRELGLDDVVEFVSHVPRRVVLQEMLDASALLIVQPITTVSVPAKLYEYMAAARPVLALAEPGGETAAVVERTGAGLAVRADDSDAIERAVVDLATRTTPWTQVPAAAFDGTRRASEVVQILHHVTAHPGAAAATSAAVSQPVGTGGARP